MNLARIHTRALAGINAPAVTVEVYISNGLPKLSIVGLPEAAVRESKDRVRAAIVNSNFEFPRRRITVNLAPADLPKKGGRFDLPIALGILAASHQIPAVHLDDYEFHGELALGGELREVSGALPIALAAKAHQKSLVLPLKNAQEAALVSTLDIRCGTSLLDVCRHLRDPQHPLETPTICTQKSSNVVAADLSDVHGQQHARRALEIAAAGLHNMLMVGPPGTGKSMLASRLPGILPPLTENQAIETASIASICNDDFDIANWKRRPFRNPHHTASGVALVGGGSNPKPGEISLAHNGVLFLDELTEFNRHVLDVLREPLETGRIVISRAARQAEFPARFQLIAAMNPCPQGYNCDGRKMCQCSFEQQQKYRARISAPLLDRIDMHIEVPRLPSALMHTNHAREESSAVVRERVVIAYRRQLERSGTANASMTGRDIEQHCQLRPNDRKLLDKALDRLKLSARACHRILKLARTIADLAGSKNIETAHLTEAIGYRVLDRWSAERS